MGQHEVAELLRNITPKYLNATELMEVLKVSRGAINHSLRKLCKRNEIQYIIKQGSQKRSGYKKYYRIKEDIENE